ncbi:uncharacterized protein K444DRAFT_662052 [Hyaloscypha bicolor E]|uniref:C2H2-type domain-containing protein n=1 Tax=Hyaloscypha bicolor E TaxID=1095630 RepID=A0A2J6TFR4_9HELO|nr:uncharacterized protein K444DRAFT_662052 [Hyaloscypha bicolor E]PMD61857.1 hypothetical protein K444DRAFT_662052 [Hyaloscypha bicolor E]
MLLILSCLMPFTSVESLHRFLRPSANFSNTIDGGNEENISMDGEDFDPYMLDSPVEDRISAAGGSSGSDAITPSSNNVQQNWLPTHIPPANSMESNFVPEVTPRSFELSSFDPSNGNFGFTGHEPLIFENDDLHYFDNDSFTFPTTSDENISFISNPGHISVTPPLYRSGTQTMGHESNLMDFPADYTSIIRQESTSPSEDVISNNENHDPPTNSLPHGNSESIPTLHPQPNSQGRFSCNSPGCTRSYKRYPELKRHRETHSGTNPPHPCSFLRCNRAGANGFRRRDHLRQHLKHVHNITI